MTVIGLLADVQTTNELCDLINTHEELKKSNIINNYKLIKSHYVKGLYWLSLDYDY